MEYVEEIKKIETRYGIRTGTLGLQMLLLLVQLITKDELRRVVQETFSLPTEKTNSITEAASQIIDRLKKNGSSITPIDNRDEPVPLMKKPPSTGMFTNDKVPVGFGAPTTPTTQSKATLPTSGNFINDKLNKVVRLNSEEGLAPQKRVEYKGVDPYKEQPLP